MGGTRKKGYKRVKGDRNLRLLEALRYEGMDHIPTLARATGTSLTTLYSLVEGRLSPKNNRGAWRRPVLALSSILQRNPDELFPEYDVEVPMNPFELDGLVESTQGAEQEELFAVEIDREALREDMVRVLGTLTDVERKVVRLRVWDLKSLAEAGKVVGVGRERIRQIELRAYRRLRHPSRRRALEEYIEH